MYKPIFILFLALATLAGCGLFPDRSREYQQAETMPDLEIPPDLTKDAVTDRMAIPGERNRTNAQSTAEDPPSDRMP